MTPQVQALLAHIFDDTEDREPDKRSCRLAQAALAELIEAALTGAAPTSATAAAWAHVQSCAECDALYRDSLKLAQAERDAKLEMPPTAAHFDFSYLDAPPMPVAPLAPTHKTTVNPLWWVDEAGRLIVRLAADFFASLQPPALQPTYLKTASQTAGETIRIAASDLTVRLHAELAATEADRCTIEATIEIPSRGGWPNLAGITVSLRQGEQELAVQETDAFGRVVFDAAPTRSLTGLECVITPPGADSRPG